MWEIKSEKLISHITIILEGIKEAKCREETTIGNDGCVSCRGEVSYVRERYPMSGRGILCPGEVSYVREKYPMSGRGIRVTVAVEKTSAGHERTAYRIRRPRESV